MDPVTIVGLVEGSISLAVQCGSVAKSLNNIAGQYKHAKVNVASMLQFLDTMQVAYDQIGVWFQGHASSENEVLMERLRRTLETGSLVLDAFEEDLKSYDLSNITFRQQSRLVFNEGILQAHQSRIKDQAQSMSLLLQAIQLRTIQGRTALLRQSQEQFTKSDESAFSIIPSRISSRLSSSTNQTGDRNSVGSPESLVYRSLSFENDLFTSRVYKRNYRPSKYRELSQQSMGHKEKVLAPPDEMTLPSCRYSSRRYGVIGSLDSTLLNEDIESYDGLYQHFVEACSIGSNDWAKTILEKTNTRRGARTLCCLLIQKCNSVPVCPIHAAVYSRSVEILETPHQYADSEPEFGRKLRDSVLCMAEDQESISGSRDGTSPIHLAAELGDLSMVLLLLRMGASVKAKDKDQVQAIHLAARTGSIEVLLALITAGADMDCLDRKRYRPLHYAADSRDQPEVIRYLVKEGARANLACPHEEKTPLDLSCKNNSVGNVKALLSLGASVTQPAFGTAINHGSPALVETLLIHVAKEDRGQCYMADGLRELLVKHGPIRMRQLRDDSDVRRKLQILLKYTDLFSTKYCDQTLLDSLLNLRCLSPGLWLGLPELILENLPDSKAVEKDIVRSVMGRKEEAISSNRSSSSDDSYTTADDSSGQVIAHSSKSHDFKLS